MKDKIVLMTALDTMVMAQAKRSEIISKQFEVDDSVEKSKTELIAAVNEAANKQLELSEHAGELIYRKPHKPNAGLKLGSYKYRSSKRK